MSPPPPPPYVHGVVCGVFSSPQPNTKSSHLGTMNPPPPPPTHTHTQKVAVASFPARHPTVLTLLPCPTRSRELGPTQLPQAVLERVVDCLVHRGRFDHLARMAATCRAFRQIAASCSFPVQVWSSEAVFPGTLSKDFGSEDEEGEPPHAHTYNFVHSRCLSEIEKGEKGGGGGGGRGVP